MDNLTHSLFALTLARTPLARAGRGATAALVLASNAPDVDVVTAAGGALEYLRWHRGPTHGLLGIVGLGLLVAGLVWCGQRAVRRSAAGQARFGALAAVSVLGVLCHVLMDLPTSYGSRMLSPFGWAWYTTDWMPIVDIFLLMVLAAGLVFGRGSNAARRRSAAIVLVLMAANYGVRASAHARALALTPRALGPLMPAPCGPMDPFTTIARWPRVASSASGDVRPVQGAPRCLVEVAALPDFLSPFHWRVVARMSNGYDVRDLNVLDPRLQRNPATGEAPWRLTVHVPSPWTEAALRAARAPDAQVFLGFSRFPTVRNAANVDGTTTVRFTDLRFAGPLGPGGGGLDSPRNAFFMVTVVLGADGRIVEQRLGP